MHPILYADEKFTGVIFETASSEKNQEVSVLGDMKDPAQKNFALLLGEQCMSVTVLCNMIHNMVYMYFAENLFHFKLAQDKYSIKPEDYTRLPLFVDDKDSKTLLNEFFFYVFSKFSSWQNMKDFQVTTMEDVHDLFGKRFAAIEGSRSGPEQPEVLSVSRNMVAYLTSFLAVAPFYSTTDLRVASRTDKFYAVALGTLSKTSDKDLSMYMLRKATAWYRRFPPVNSPDRIDDDQPRGDGGVGETEDDKVDEDRAVEMSDAEGSDAV